MLLLGSTNHDAGIVIALSFAKRNGPKSSDSARGALSFSCLPLYAPKQRGSYMSRLVFGVPGSPIFRPQVAVLTPKKTLPGARRSFGRPANSPGLVDSQLPSFSR
ncbi:uncharacterized protein YALI1_A02301g [Yarrowia lipolytica]|uniref:Uncharacterized protein n=1 Tax=Yarrowia lipolytica TaxID=4952 RepID=A0A1D8N3F4_YARLL|nr:hypothetical protein YALI1_A02301g [Yarrowia lipolytica]